MNKTNHTDSGWIFVVAPRARALKPRPSTLVEYCLSMPYLDEIATAITYWSTFKLEGKS